MSTEQGRNKYYVDFKEGGVVHSSPTRLLPELVFTGRIKSQLDIQLEQHAKMVQEILGESAYEGSRLGKTVHVARPIFIGLSLPFPGLIELRDSFYTGWFYTSESGKMYSALHKKDNISLSPHVRQARRIPYFLLDKAQATLWDERIKQGQLSVEQIDELFLSPGIDAHASYESLSRSNLKELTDKVVVTADSFWIAFETLDRNDRSITKRDFLRNNLIDLVILDQIHDRSHRVALAEVRELMERNEITAFPLGGETCIVRYLTDDARNRVSIPARTISIPHRLMGSFQRYGRLGERPMTAKEFERQYRTLVDPKTKLFGNR